jgi:hypothetical protein
MQLDLCLLKFVRVPEKKKYYDPFDFGDSGCDFFLTLQDVSGTILGGVIGHALCTGLAVMGGRFIAQKISIRTGKTLLS